MSSTEGPVTLTLGTVVPVPNPTAQWGNPATNVQVQNSSSFVIEVTAGGEVFTIQSFTAQTVPTPADGQPITIEAVQNLSAGTPATSATVVWLLSGESPPMQDGPLTAAAIAQALTVNTQSFTNQFSQNFNGVAGPGLALNLTAALKTYSGLYVIVTIFGTGVLPSALAFYAYDETVGGMVTAAALQAAPGFPHIFQGEIPFICLQGDNIAVQVQLSGVLAAGQTAAVSLQGITQFQAAIPMRADGRAHPLGVLAADVQAAFNTSGNLVAAPPLPSMRLLLKSLVCYATIPAGGGSQIGATIGGNAILLASLNSTPQGSSNQTWESGLLLDINTPLTYSVANVANAFLGAAVVYDVVF